MTATAPSLPITAIVIFRNERRHLGRCLDALRFCAQIIGVDMQSSDGSRDIALQYVDDLLEAPVYPIAEPTRVAAAAFARHPWILLVDPDEVIPPALARDLAEVLRTRPGAGAVSMPMRFYFKQKPLTATVWGTLTWKRRLIHRDRCRLLPHCNRLTGMIDGFEDVRLPSRGDNVMRHYWSDSYLDLLKKHFRRYAHLEAKAMVAEGRRFGFELAVRFPLFELRRTLRDFDGWRIGPRGWALSAIYFGYVIASCWLTLWYQGRVRPDDARTHAVLPTLTRAAIGSGRGEPIRRQAA